jgi:hypothetical protein
MPARASTHLSASSRQADAGGSNIPPALLQSHDMLFFYAEVRKMRLLRGLTRLLVFSSLITREGFLFFVRRLYGQR